MATPLDLRNRRREAQRTVRLALNAFNSGLDRWKRAAAEGKVCASELANAILAEKDLPALVLGPLDGIAGLLPAAAVKLQQQQEQHFRKLQACLLQLKDALHVLRVALGTVSELLEVEATSLLLGKGAVFAALSLATIGKLLQEVVDMYAAEQRVKEAVLAGFEQVPGQFFDRGPHLDTRSKGGERQDARGERLGKVLQVYLTAWLLSPEVDDQRVETNLACITEDMRGL